MLCLMVNMILILMFFNDTFVPDYSNLDELFEGLGCFSDEDMDALTIPFDIED